MAVRRQLVCIQWRIGSTVIMRSTQSLCGWMPEHHTIGNNPGNVQCFLSAEYPDVGIKASMANLGQPITLLVTGISDAQQSDGQQGYFRNDNDVYGNVMTEMLEQQRKDITETMAHTQRKISLVEGQYHLY